MLVRVGVANGGRQLSADRHFHLLLTVPPRAAFAVAGRPASSSPQVSVRSASTGQCSVSGVFRAGRCVVGVDIAPNDERRADVPEIRTFRRHPAERRQERQEGGEQELLEAESEALVQEGVARRWYLGMNRLVLAWLVARASASAPSRSRDGREIAAECVRIECATARVVLGTVCTLCESMYA